MNISPHQRNIFFIILNIVDIVISLNNNSLFKVKLESFNSVVIGINFALSLLLLYFKNNHLLTTMQSSMKYIVWLKTFLLVVNYVGLDLFKNIQLLADDKFKIVNRELDAANQIIQNHYEEIFDADDSPLANDDSPLANDN